MRRVGGERGGWRRRGGWGGGGGGERGVGKEEEGGGGCRHARVGSVEDGFGVPGSITSRWRGAAADAGSDGVDVPEADRGERNSGRGEWLAGGAPVGDATGAGGIGVAECAQNTESAIVGPPEGPARGG